MFDYIISFYFGHRRSKITNELSYKDKYHFIKEHLKLISSSETLKKDIDKAIFVINDSKKEDGDNVRNIINSFGLSNLVSVLERDNIDYSYGGWNDALISRLNSECQYAFLCEDDYIPAVDNFYTHFIKLFDNDTVYVCQLYIRSHAAISNGFICYDKCREVYNQENRIFKLNNGLDYISACNNQVTFLYLLSKYKIIDITEKYQSRFMNTGNGREIIVNYGNPNGIELIKPILE